MEIKAIRMFDHGFMTQAFAFGGEDPKGTYDDQIIYRSSLQNFLIDTFGNSIVVAENEGLYYLFHGDVTYTDAALKAMRTWR